MPKAISPASGGPTGSQFEVQVGATYLLAMLCDSDPQGLPGTIFDSVAFQRRGSDYPLDDVIIKAHDHFGSAATLEIQVKRTLSFAPSDREFREVVAQMVASSKKPDFQTTRYELAVAISRSSKKIDGAYRDVLARARQAESTIAFFSVIRIPGAANDDMKTFVETFTAHMIEAGSSGSDEDVWSLLRRFQILRFDYDLPSSDSLSHALLRAAHVLHEGDTSRAISLWHSLISIALASDSAAGGRTLTMLRQELRESAFRFSGARRYHLARTAIEEASRLALSDIPDRIGRVHLTRHSCIDAIRAAMDEGHYIEILGDPGVGKSGVLKAFAEQCLTESTTLVLTAERIVAGGWLALKGMLQFDGQAQELLSDLAASGGGFLLIDGLDFVPDPQKLTVKDLVREAAAVPGVFVIATARRDFDKDEPNWLPEDVLTRLGRSKPVVVSELSDSEIDQLRSLSPELTPLLAINHPAKGIVRNLFRLNRLQQLPATTTGLRTEIDMAVQWWQSADGLKDDLLRGRARAIRKLTSEVLNGNTTTNVSDQNGDAIDELKERKTFHELNLDVVVFGHDVLRDWAIANCLFDDESKVEYLRLDRPPPAPLRRGIALFSRLRLERQDDAMKWFALLEYFGRPSVHPAWRRLALLAVIESEADDEVMQKASAVLLRDAAGVLRELIRTTMAVNVQPAASVLAPLGVDPSTIPKTLTVVSGPTWIRLILWLLKVHDQLPPEAIQEVCDLYAKWSLSFWGRDAISPLIAYRMVGWLNQIEDTSWRNRVKAGASTFFAPLSEARRASLEKGLRGSFFLFCDRTPDLAAEYLNRQCATENPRRLFEKVMKFRGQLAKAAPEELMKVAQKVLINDDRNSKRNREHLGPYSSFEAEFMPESPNQGPFLELLENSARHGLLLIRNVVEHAIRYENERHGRSKKNIILRLPSEHTFTDLSSYNWSRVGSFSSCVTCALMALEAWCHRRIERHENLDAIVADVVSVTPTPAAFLLVVVDLVLSHWPDAASVAAVLLESPELMALDRQRYAHDSLSYSTPEVFDLTSLMSREPRGSSSAASLRARASRHASLDDLLGQFMRDEFAQAREGIVSHLRHAIEQLGPYGASADLTDPAFVGARALNVLNIDNWKRTDVGMEYVAPEAESAHLEALQSAHLHSGADTSTSFAILAAVDDAGRTKEDQVRSWVLWARDAERHSYDTKDEKEFGSLAIVAAAMILFRNGSKEIIDKNSEWAHAILLDALRLEPDKVHTFQAGLKYNPLATAFAGLIYLNRGKNRVIDLQLMLEATGSRGNSVGRAYIAAFDELNAIDVRLPQAFLRTAFEGAIYETRKGYLEPEESSDREDRARERLVARVSKEFAWIRGAGPQPEWPLFAHRAVRLAPRIIIGGRDDEIAAPRDMATPDLQVDSQCAAIWLSRIARPLPLALPWREEIVDAYLEWTLKANGAGLADETDITHEPSEWNHAFFRLVVCALLGSSPRKLEGVVGAVCLLPEDSFFEVIPSLFRQIQDVYFNEPRCAFNDVETSWKNICLRIMQTQEWRRHAHNRSPNVSRAAGPAIAMLLMNDYSGFGSPTCYLRSPALTKLLPLLPNLEITIKGAPSYLVAIATLNLIEIFPRGELLHVALTAANTWLDAFPGDVDFWVDNRMGQRICQWLSLLYTSDPLSLKTNPDMQDVVPNVLSVVARLVSAGVTDAVQLEQTLIA